MHNTVKRIAAAGGLTVLLAAFGQVPAQAQTAAQRNSADVGGLAGAPAGQLGQAPAAQRFIAKFRAANTTGDGRLTLAQAQAGHMPWVVKNFTAMDQGRRGYVEMADIRAYRRQQRMARLQQQGGGQPMPGGRLPGGLQPGQLPTNHIAPDDGTADPSP